MIIDSLEFARRHETLAGRLRLDEMPRLADTLFDAAGRLDYEVTGETDGRNAFLTVRLDGVLSLNCQRCLGALTHALSQRSRIMLVERGAPWPEDSQVGGLEDEACDAIEALCELDLVPLFEEEILLALPIAPRHERCELPSMAAVSRQTSPFAQLAALKRK